MKTEREMDAALKMLGEVQAPAGLTAHVQRSLATAAAAGHTRKNWRVWVPVGGAVMAAVLLTALFQIRSAPEKIAATAKRTTTDSALPEGAISQQSQIPPDTFRERKASLSVVRPSRHTARHAEYRHAANLFDYPLTRQEKLLVEFVQTAKPEDLQMLNPAYQAKLEAQQEAEFAAYLNSGNNSSTQATTETATNPSSQE